MVKAVRITAAATKQLKRVPAHIAIKLQKRVDGVENEGLLEIRKIPGYHDEPLKGDLEGKRSIRLSQAYRAIYEIKADGTIEFAEIQKVSKHEY